MVLDFDRLCVPLRDVISSTEFWVEIIGVARIFDGGANHKSHAMTSSEIFKKGTLCGTKIS